MSRPCSSVPRTCPSEPMGMTLLMTLPFMAATLGSLMEGRTGAKRAARTIRNSTTAAAKETLSRRNRHQASFQWEIGLAASASTAKPVSPDWDCVIVNRSSCTTYPRVDHCVQDVHNEVKHDEHGSQYQHRALNNGDVPLLDG